MNDTLAASRAPRLERILVAVDAPPWDAVYRTIVGFIAAAAWTTTRSAETADGGFIVFFLGVLVALRLAPAVARRLLPFSPAARATWLERRQNAVKYDSYQWQKMFWLGLGIALYGMSAGVLRGSIALVAIVCLTSGACGLAMWRSRKAKITDEGRVKGRLTTA